MVLALLQRKCFNFDRKPDKGWSWLVMIGSFAMMMVFDGTLSAFGIIKSELINDTYIKTLNHSRSIFTYPGTVSVCTFLCSTLLGSIIMGYIGLMFTGLIGSTLIFAGIFSCSFTTNIYAWIFLYGIVNGIGQGFILLLAISSVNIYFDRFRGIASGISMSGAGFGCIIVPYLLNFLIKTHGFWQAIRYFALFSFAINFFFSLIMLQITDSDYYAEKSMKEANLTENVEALLNEAASEILRAKEYQCPDSSNFESHKKKRKISRMMSINSNSYVSRIFNTMQTEDEPQNWGTFSEIKQSYSRDRDTSKIISSRQRLDVDVFYSGSIRSLQLISAKTPNRLGQLEQIEEESLDNVSIKQKDSLMSRYRDIFTTPEFHVISIISVGFISGYIVPFYYLEPYSAGYITRDRIINVFQCIGIMNAFGRLFGGLMGNVPCVDLVILSMTSYFICGLNHFLFVYLPINLTSVFLYGAIHGFFIGIPATLNTLIIVQYLGLESLTYSLGMINIIKAISGFLGPLTIEKLISGLNSTGVAFVYYGISLIVAGLAHFIIVILRCIKKRK